jgi:hypothetical protein
MQEMARFQRVTENDINLDVENATPIATIRKRKWAMKIFEQQCGCIIHRKKFV